MIYKVLSSSHSWFIAWSIIANHAQLQKFIEKVLLAVFIGIFMQNSYLDHFLKMISTCNKASVVQDQLECY